MKIIDLITMLANDEKMPNKIKWNTEEWEYIEELKDYYSYDRHAHLFNTVFPNDGLAEFLNDEVEIIEEEKEIGYLQLPSFEKFKNMTPAERYKVTAIEYDKLNEIIDKLNDMRDKNE